MGTKIFEDYFTQLDRQPGAKSRTILLFIDQYATHPKNNTFLPSNCTNQLQPFDLGIHDTWGLLQDVRGEAG
jgi:hypothetical protein